MLQEIKVTLLEGKVVKMESELRSGQGASLGVSLRRHSKDSEFLLHYRSCERT